MIAIVRISGDVKIREKARETMIRLGLTKKYSCIVLEKPSQVELGMLEKVKDFVAFGELDEETFKELGAKRGKKFKEKTKVFRLHPPRGGIDSKLHFGVRKGVLGNNGGKIGELIRRML